MIVSVVTTGVLLAKCVKPQEEHIAYLALLRGAPEHTDTGAASQRMLGEGGKFKGDGVRTRRRSPASDAGYIPPSYTYLREWVACVVKG